MPGHPDELRGDRVENERVGAPRAADDDEFRVGQHAALLLDAGDGGAQRGSDLVRAGRPVDALFRPGQRVAMGVKAFGHDPVRRDAQGQGDSDVGQGVVRAHR
jgi:hypothetical protein